MQQQSAKGLQKFAGDCLKAKPRRLFWALIWSSPQEVWEPALVLIVMLQSLPRSHSAWLFASPSISGNTCSTLQAAPQAVHFHAFTLHAAQFYTTSTAIGVKCRECASPASSQACRT